MIKNFSIFESNEEVLYERYEFYKQGSVIMCRPPKSENFTSTMLVNIPKNDIEILEDLICQYQLYFQQSKDKNFGVIKTSFDSDIHFIILYYTEDDYYFVSSLSNNSHGNSNSKTNYRCDNIDGLIKYLSKFIDQNSKFFVKDTDQKKVQYSKYKSRIYRFLHDASVEDIDQLKALYSIIK